jgi:glycine cleavage system H protein
MLGLARNSQASGFVVFEISESQICTNRAHSNYLLCVFYYLRVLKEFYMASWNVPAELKYTENDEWIRLEDDVATIGITDYAQDQLNDIVYVEFKEVGDAIDANDSIGEVESVKASSEIYSPISGEIIEVNETLVDESELVNTDPYGAGWMVKLQVADASGLDALMDAEAYAKYCDER